MKLIHGILGCALAAGLTAGTALADTVIGNTVFTPLNIKLTGRFNNSNGTVKELRITSKDILQLLGFPKDKLMINYDGFGGVADVFIVDKNGIVADLTTEEILAIAFNQIVIKHDNSNKDGSFNQEEKGVLTLHFDFTGVMVSGVAAQGALEVPASDFSFDVNGVYLWQKSGKAIKKGDQKIATKLTSDTFVGDGFDSNIAPTIQSKVPGGTGEFLIKDGTVDGVGAGKISVD